MGDHVEIRRKSEIMYKSCLVFLVVIGTYVLVPQLLRRDLRLFRRVGVNLGGESSVGAAWD